MLNVKALVNFKTEGGPSRDLLHDCENRWIVCSSIVISGGSRISARVEILITSRDGVPDELPVLAHGLPVAGQRLLVLEADLLEHAARSLHQGLRLPPREHRHKWTLRFHREI